MALKKTAFCVFAAAALCANAAERGMTMLPGTVKNFELPNFADDTGYRDWELFGATAHYVSDDKIVVTELKLDIYDGKLSQVKRATFTTPSADIYPNAEEGGGNDEMTVIGETFKLTGKRWLWSGKNSQIDIFSDVNLDIKRPKETVSTFIKSDTARFEHGGKDNIFLFSKNVSVKREDTVTLCRELRVEAPKDAKGGDESVKLIEARGAVKVSQPQRHAEGEYARIAPDAKTVELTGKPKLIDEKSRASLSGSKIFVDKLKNAIFAFAGVDGRANAVIIDERKDKDPETVVVSSDKITLTQSADKSKNTFDFKGGVEVFSAEFKALCDELTAYSQGDAKKDGRHSLTKIDGKNNVRLFKDKGEARASAVEILPREGIFTLTGGATLEEKAKGVLLQSDSMRLFQNDDKADAFSKDGDAKSRVVVTMSQGADSITGREGGAKTTVIRSKTLHTEKVEGVTLLNFKGDVDIDSGDVKAECENMDVYALEDPAAKGKEVIKQIVASKDVQITQENYKAKAQLAFIFPKAEEDSAQVAKKPASHRFVELAISPDFPNVRPCITLPPFKNAGLSPSAAAQKSAAPAAQDTVITSNRQSLVGGADADRYYFEGNVEIEGSGMTGSCDKIEVIIKNAPPANAPAQAPATALTAAPKEEKRIDKIILFGNVKIAQGLKSATCGRADIYPVSETIILSQNPVVLNKEDNTRATGARIVYKNGVKGVSIEGGLSEDYERGAGQEIKRPSVILPKIGTKLPENK